MSESGRCNSGRKSDAMVTRLVGSGHDGAGPAGPQAHHLGIQTNIVGTGGARTRSSHSAEQPVDSSRLAQGGLEPAPPTQQNSRSTRRASGTRRRQARRHLMQGRIARAAAIKKEEGRGMGGGFVRHESVTLLLVGIVSELEDRTRVVEDSFCNGKSCVAVATARKIQVRPPFPVSCGGGAASGARPSLHRLARGLHCPDRGYQSMPHAARASQPPTPASAGGGPLPGGMCLCPAHCDGCSMGCSHRNARALRQVLLARLGRPSPHAPSLPPFRPLYSSPPTLSSSSPH
jgi:hypothetical protein